MYLKEKSVVWVMFFFPFFVCGWGWVHVAARLRRLFLRFEHCFAEEVATLLSDAKRIGSCSKLRTNSRINPLSYFACLHSPPPPLPTYTHTLTYTHTRMWINEQWSILILMTNTNYWPKSCK